MATRYYVLASDDLMAMNLSWPACLRPVEQLPAYQPLLHPGMHWWLFEDDDAPAELDGKNVELTFEHQVRPPL